MNTSNYEPQRSKPRMGKEAKNCQKLPSTASLGFKGLIECTGTLLMPIAPFKSFIIWRPSFAPFGRVSGQSVIGK